MKDDSISPDQSSDDQSGDTGKVYANISSLAVGDQGTTPEVGDEVELTIKGTVDSVDGDIACVSPTEVNGDPAPAAPASDNSEPAGDDPNSERNRLYKMAEQADNGNA